MRRALCALIALVMLFSACGPGKTPAGGPAGEGKAAAARSAPGTVDPTGQVLTFWYQHSGTRDAAMKKMISDFNTHNPWNIKVKGEFAGNYEQIYNKMMAAISAGRPPAMVVAYQNQAATYELSDAIVDLNPYVHDPRWGIGGEIGDFFAGFINQDVNAQYEGKRLGFPPNRSIEVLYYNAAWLRELGLPGPPRTWADFAAACRKAVDRGKGTYGYALDNLDASHLFAFVISRGGDFVRPGRRGYALDTPAMRDSMTFMRDLVREGAARKIAMKFDDQTEFGNRRCLFAISSTSGLPFYDQAVKAGKGGGFAWSVAPVPQESAAGSPALNLYGASVSVCRTTPPAELAAWLFIRWFAEPKQQAEWARVSNYFPVRRSAEPLIKDLFSSNEQFRAAWDVLKTADLRSEPPYAGYDLVRDAMVAAYSMVLNGADVDTTLADLEARANRIYDESAP